MSDTDMPTPAMRPQIRVFRALYTTAYDAAIIFSPAFVKEYQRRYNAPDFNEWDGQSDMCDYENRMNPRFLEIIDEMGRAAFLPQCQDYEFFYVPEELKDYFVVCYYEQRENPEIEFDRYHTDTLKSLLGGEITLEEARAKYERAEFIREKFWNGQLMYDNIEVLN